MSKVSLGVLQSVPRIDGPFKCFYIQTRQNAVFENLDLSSKTLFNIKTDLIMTVIMFILNYCKTCIVVVNVFELLSDKWFNYFQTNLNFVGSKLIVYFIRFHCKLISWYWKVYFYPTNNGIVIFNCNIFNIVFKLNCKYHSKFSTKVTCF